MTTLQAFCARLLREEALEAGVDPFVTPVTAADRLALLLERIDELPLASHDLRGNPSAVLGSIVQRIDRLKDELVTAADYAAWAATLPEDGETARARAVREREFAAIYAAHDRLLAEGGTLDAGDLVLHAFRLLRGKPDIRARLAARFHHVLVDEFQDTNFAQNLLLRLLVTDHGNLCVAADDDAAITRFRGASTKNIVDFRAEWPEARVVRLTESRRSGGRILAAAAAVVAPDPGRIEKRLEAPDGHAARRGGVLALRERAGAGAGGRRGRRAARVARRRRAGGRLRARPLGQGRGPGRRRGAGGARGPVPARRARPPSSSARRSATCSPGCGCSPTPATPAPWSARSPARRSSCARSTSRAARRSPAGASSTWSRRSARRWSRPRSRPRRASGSPRS